MQTKWLLFISVRLQLHLILHETLTIFDYRWLALTIVD